MLLIAFSLPLLFFLLLLICCWFSSVARQNDTNPNVVALFLKHAACHNMTANVTMPQQKGMFSSKEKFPLLDLYHFWSHNCICTSRTLYMNEEAGKEVSREMTIITLCELIFFMFWIMITTWFFLCSNRLASSSMNVMLPRIFPMTQIKDI